jgi:cGMP-dependent protein kinase
LGKGALRGRTVLAKSNEVLLLAISRTTTLSILGEKIQILAFRNMLRWAFEKDLILAKLLQM